MSFEADFITIPLEALHREAAIMKMEAWRFIQTHAVNTDSGIDLYYSFMKDGRVKNLKVEGVTKDDAVPSVTDLFLAAFVFENEARELFGVDMRDIAIDFAGAMYAPALTEPMTIMTPEQKAARDKARKARGAKAAKAEGGAGEANLSNAHAQTPGRVFVMTPERKERLAAKMATMSAEKRAKVEAALKAREAEATSASGDDASAPVKKKVEDAVTEAAPVELIAKKADAVLESKIAALDPDKAAKIRTALARRAGVAGDAGEPGTPAEAKASLDAAVETIVARMDAEKAQRVRAAFDARASRGATTNGGE